ncbi:fungal-specific transcription factor domain-containing protein [Dactylonectria estremocensis]|uniref:Fungal-specific transcription factor domain-containing protein n=1 Tax=Dactylonectria estremocensis TaxID=1079267 RepID=A0A9P9DJH9_9HYPO|nr:fungal-specific transcription factor domain-containing protein [Dactylonectria estremocensis]
MTSRPSTSEPLRLNKNACSLCARRKVKCDKSNPCSNCIKAQTECTHEAAAPYRPRKRAADEDLLARLARYEDLMRENNVDFAHCANTWVPSGLEAQGKDSNVQTPISTIPGVSGPKSSSSPLERPTANTQLSLWSTLSSELKYPPIQSLGYNDDPALDPEPLPQFVITGNEPKIEQLHPEAKHVYRLWQTFVENVNPLLKIVHVPTLQQRVLDACWSPATQSKPLTAILLIVYALAVTSMSSDDCFTTFGETRNTLLVRYRTAALRALIEADFLISRDFEVLQAFVMFLFIDPESELTSTLCGAAVSIAHKMGLHRVSTDSRMSIFDKEMRIRLWWQLFAMDCRCRIASNPGMKPPLDMFGELRPPLNVNDVDLHPDMTESPAEHTGPTEMMGVLTKSQIFNFMRHSKQAAKGFQGVVRVSTKCRTSTELEDGVINDIDSMYQEQQFGKWDNQIPLHRLSRAISKLNVAHMRLKVHHPRWRGTVRGGEVYMTHQECDLVFESALTMLEMIDLGLRSNFSSRLFIHMTAKPPIDAYIYVLSELRQRPRGERVDVAWKLVEGLYNKHPELIKDTANSFFAAFRELTLEAWQFRRKELVVVQGAREFDLTPRYIQLLWEGITLSNEQSLRELSAPDTHEFGVLGMAEGEVLDWENWNTFYF